MISFLKSTSVASLLTLEILTLGCSNEKFPKLDGRFDLVSFNYSNSSFKGRKIIPKSLDVIDRMEHHGGSWIHDLKFKFISTTSSEAEGEFTLRLNDLINIDNNAWPNNGFNGANVLNEKKVYGTSAFCDYQYQYNLFVESTPSPDILKKVYPGQGDNLEKDPFGMDQHESLNYPQEVELNKNAVKEWYNILDNNEGITLKFTFSRQIKSNYPGWENGYKDCILPDDPRKEESLTFTYHSIEEDNYTDIRKTGLEDLQVNNSTAKYFFNEIISEMKL